MRERERERERERSNNLVIYRVIRSKLCYVKRSITLINNELDSCCHNSGTYFLLLCSETRLFIFLSLSSCVSLIYIYIYI